MVRRCEAFIVCHLCISDSTPNLNFIRDDDESESWCENHSHLLCRSHLFNHWQTLSYTFATSTACSKSFRMIKFWAHAKQICSGKNRAWFQFRKKAINDTCWLSCWQGGKNLFGWEIFVFWKFFNHRHERDIIFPPRLGCISIFEAFWRDLSPKRFGFFMNIPIFSENIFSVFKILFLFFLVFKFQTRYPILLILIKPKRNWTAKKYFFNQSLRIVINRVFGLTDEIEHISCAIVIVEGESSQPICHRKAPFISGIVIRLSHFELYIIINVISWVYPIPIHCAALNHCQAPNIGFCRVFIE